MAQLLEDRRRAKETLDELTEGSNSNSSNDMDVEDAAEELETLETELALSKTSLRELDRKLSGEAAAAGLGAADPADKAALLAIPGLQDCIRPLQTEVSALSPPALVALAKGLVSSHVEALYIRTRHDGVVAALRSELDSRYFISFGRNLYSSLLFLLYHCFVLYHLHLFHFLFLMVYTAVCCLQHNTDNSKLTRQFASHNWGSRNRQRGLAVCAMITRRRSLSSWPSCVLLSRN